LVHACSQGQVVDSATSSTIKAVDPELHWTCSFNAKSEELGLKTGDTY
jgi:hypothetical protein